MRDQSRPVRTRVCAGRDISILTRSVKSDHRLDLAEQIVSLLCLAPVVRRMADGLHLHGAFTVLGTSFSLRVTRSERWDTRLVHSFGFCLLVDLSSNPARLLAGAPSQVLALRAAEEAAEIIARSLGALSADPSATYLNIRMSIERNLPALVL